jgi:sugar phosphate permease
LLQYITFIMVNLRFLGFGYLIAVSSTFGQTFYIAMYGEQIRTEFGLTHGDFGSVYAIGTLTSGLLIIAVGNIIDRVDLRIYAPALCTAMAGACLMFSIAESVMVLTAAIFALRICGQGLLSQAATVTMARYFNATTRGRAVSIAALGFPTGQALFPLAAVLLLAWLPWRDIWLYSAALVLLVMPLATSWLLVGHGDRHAKLTRERAAYRDSPVTSTSHRDWTRRDVIKDFRFGFAAAAMLATSFVITGLNFHQVHLVSVKGWDLGIYASSFAIYAVAQVTASVITGVVVDRIGAVRLLPFYMLPLAFAALVISAVDATAALAVFMVLAGASGGAGATIVSTVWAELYGVTHLGSIRALFAGLAVISSALAPAAFGFLIDGGTGIETIAAACGAYTIVGSLVLGVVFKGQRPPS